MPSPSLLVIGPMYKRIALRTCCCPKPLPCNFCCAGTQVLEGQYEWSLDYSPEWYNSKLAYGVGSGWWQHAQAAPHRLVETAVGPFTQCQWCYRARYEYPGAALEVEMCFGISVDAANNRRYVMTGEATDTIGTVIRDADERYQKIDADAGCLDCTDLCQYFEPDGMLFTGDDEVRKDDPDQIGLPLDCNTFLNYTTTVTCLDNEAGAARLVGFERWPCVYRGEQSRKVRRGRGCSMRVEQVLGCKVHGECAVREAGPGVMVCGFCKDRLE